MAMSTSVSGLGTRVPVRTGESQHGPQAERTASPTGPAAGGLDASGSGTVASTLAVLLSRLDLSEGPQRTAGSEQAVEPAPRPNLDALNRVLNHYAAQTAAANLPFIVEN